MTTPTPTPANWYEQTNGEQKYWDGGKYIATWQGSDTPHGVPMEEHGFFHSLFDLSFTSFITLKILSIVYAASVFLVILGGILLFVRFLVLGDANVFYALAVPVVAVLVLIFVRVSLELTALFFRIGQDIRQIAAQ
jgi:Domain of unknown function (DUF4282)